MLSRLARLGGLLRPRPSPAPPPATDVAAAAVVDEGAASGAAAAAEPQVAPAADPAPSNATPPLPSAPRGAALLDDPSGYATAARVWITELRLEHGRGPDGDDVRRLLDLLADDRSEGVRQLPGAAQASLALCDDPYAGVPKLAAACGRDPTVAQALLRHANSAYYRRGGGDASHLDAAVERVGVGGVRSVLLGVAVRGLLSRPGGDLEPVATAVWAHLVRAAPLARAVAPALGAAPEAAYVVALLHDVGKLVLLDRVTELRVARRRDPRFPPRFVGDAFRRLHEPLGALAALRWGLGPAAARAIGAHHRDASMAPGADPLGEAAFLAERADLAAVRGEPFDAAAAWAAGALGGSAERGAAALAAAADA